MENKSVGAHSVRPVLGSTIAGWQINSQFDLREYGFRYFHKNALVFCFGFVYNININKLQRSPEHANSSQQRR